MSVKHIVPPHLNSDEVAHKLVEANMGLVNFCIKIWFHHSKNHDDLQGYGYLGLVKASKRFNPAYGWKFCTYAVPVIKRDIQDGLRQSLFTIRIPSNTMSRVYSKEDTEYTRDAVRAMKMFPLKPSVGRQKKERYSDEFKDVHKALTWTSERIREIYIKRFGIHGCVPMSVTDIAKEKKISKQRVCQLLAEGADHIKTYYRIKSIDPHHRDETVRHEWNRTAKDRILAWKESMGDIDNGDYCSQTESGEYGGED